MKKGLFWCVDHNINEPSLVTKAVECDIHGNAVTENVIFSSKSGGNFNHKIEWAHMDKSISKGNKYNYYPRGRVEIKNSKVIIFLNPDINSENVIRKIIDEFELTDVTDIKIVADGSKHYEYQKCHGR